MKQNKMREEMKEAFINALKEEKIPWQCDWIRTGRPENAVTGKMYRGLNLLWLSRLQEEKRYQDPRWCTFKQAQEKDWKIREGEEASRIEFWSLYDTGTKRDLTNREAEELEKQMGDEFYNRVKPVSRVYTVFNAEQIEGIPERVMERDHFILDEGMLMEKREILLRNMGLSFSEGGTGTYYLPQEDQIVMPEIDRFRSEYGYISTLLHEAAHATGHKSRLGRDIDHRPGTPDYAREELRAEIASAFVAQELGIAQAENNHMENHKAYIQDCITVLEKDPDELFAAIRDAEKIADYLMDKGEFDLEKGKIEKRGTEMDKYNDTQQDRIRTGMEEGLDFHILTEGQGGMKLEQENGQNVMEKSRASILGYYSGEDGSQYIHYLAGYPEKEFLTTGMSGWEDPEDIKRIMSQLKQIPHLTDRELILDQLQQNEPYAPITRHMQEIVGEVSFSTNRAVGEVIQFTDVQEYLKTVEEEIEYQSSSGFGYRTFTDDPETWKGIDDIVYDMYGERNPHDLDYYRELHSPSAHTDDMTPEQLYQTMTPEMQQLYDMNRDFGDQEGMGNLLEEQKQKLEKINGRQETDIVQEQTVSKVDYKLVQDVAEMEEKLNFSPEKRLTERQTDDVLFAPKKGIQGSDLMKRREEFQKHYVPLFDTQEAAKLRLTAKGRECVGFQPDPAHLKAAQMIHKYQEAGLDVGDIVSGRVEQIREAAGIQDPQYAKNLVCSIVSWNKQDYENYMGIRPEPDGTSRTGRETRQFQTGQAKSPAGRARQAVRGGIGR